MNVEIGFVFFFRLWWHGFMGYLNIYGVFTSYIIRDKLKSLAPLTIIYLHFWLPRECFLYFFGGGVRVGIFCVTCHDKTKLSHM